jgi:hypothetical protein
VRDTWIDPSPVRLLEGTEAFEGLDARVIDFWRWAMSDLRMNTIRPMLAEFLVARAVGDPKPARVEWANHDVTSADGIRIEVKSSGYLQSWRQRKLSKPAFSRFSARVWDPETSTYGNDAEVRADVFVFCVQMCRAPAEYNPLDVSQWSFHVIRAAIVRGCRKKSFGMAFVLQHAPDAIRWDELRDAVALATAPPQPAR